MKRRSALILLSVAIVLCFMVPGIMENLVLFVLAGIVPGTKWSIPPHLMLIGLGVAFLAVLYWAKRRKLYLPSGIHVVKSVKTSKKSQARSAGRRLRQAKRLARQTA